MNLNALIKDWLTFSKKERTGIFILIVISILLWVLPLFFSNGDVPDEILSISRVRYDSAKVILVRNSASDSYVKVQKGFNFNRNYKENSSGQQPKKIDVNLADSAALESLPGIGEKLSIRIVRYRDRLGGFVSLEQLKEVYGLSDSTFIFIRRYLDVGEAFKPLQIAVNKADYVAFRRHPYMNAPVLKALLAYRKTHGSIPDFKSCELIARQIGDSLPARLKPYLDFGN
jgi:DNA uptake protein ComE-like DNA-binding protein